MATTTALITGAVLSELLKVAQNITDLDRYRGLHINTALNSYWITRVEKAGIITGGRNDEVLGFPTIAIPEGCTEWDRIEIKGSITIQELIDHISKTYNVEVSVIVSGTFVLYRKYSKLREKMAKMSIEGRYEEVTENKILEDELELTVEGFINKEEKLKALMPKFKYIVKG